MFDNPSCGSFLQFLAVCSITEGFALERKAFEASVYYADIVHIQKLVALHCGLHLYR